MSRAVIVIFLVGLASLASSTSFLTDAELETSFTAPLLTAFVSDLTPWKNIIANSDQVQPVYLGAKPREIALEIANVTNSAFTPVLASLQALGEKQLKRLVSVLKVGSGLFLFEGWPAYDQSSGLYSWTWARYKRVSDDEWTFIWSDLDDQGNYTTGFLPQVYKPWVEQDAYDIWTPVMEIPELYAKPVFGDCVWTAEDSSNVYGAWYNPSQMETIKERVLKINAKAPRGKRIWCVTMPQPCRSSGKPTSFVVQIQGSTVRWPTAINWTATPTDLPNIPMTLTPLVSFPANFSTQLATDIKIFDGESVATFPTSGRQMTFTKKSSAQNDSELLDLISYLEERYALLGIQTKRTPFKYLGIDQGNLIAYIPGTDPALKPVVFADHIDTAFAEDIFDETGQRVANPGADDNAAAVATLINAAALLAKLNLPSEIQLVHLTGEEYPGDDLGVRNYLSGLLKAKLDIRAMVLMDMISYRGDKSDKVVQVNAGASPSSLFAATVAMRTASLLNSTVISPVYRPRWDPKSYLFQTDGVILDSIGYPVILINEHINMLENFDRPYYHQSTDLFATLDMEYGTEVAKLAVETVAQLAAWNYTPPASPKPSTAAKKA